MSRPKSLRSDIGQGWATGGFSAASATPAVPTGPGPFRRLGRTVVSGYVSRIGGPAYGQRDIAFHESRPTSPQTPPRTPMICQGRRRGPTTAGVATRALRVTIPLTPACDHRGPADPRLIGLLELRSRQRSPTTSPSRVAMLVAAGGISLCPGHWFARVPYQAERWRHY